ncbi:MAG: hypothetical protein JKP90_10220 [Desulfofustis sp. PB-SRB1]|nr:hypothetical protein [Desulfofustis sp. PB-SRB1]
MAATNNTEKRRVDEQLARLALASGSSESAKTCPDIDTLSTLIEDPGRCRDRDTILAHLAGCEACYQQWVDLSKAYAKETVHTKRRTIIKMIVRPATWPPRVLPWRWPPRCCSTWASPVSSCAGRR